MRFKIRSLMIAVGVIAVLMAAATVPGFFAVLLLGGLLISSAAVAFGLWSEFRHDRRRSHVGFCVSAAVIDCVCITASIAMPTAGLFVAIITVLICVILTPVILGFGAAWCTAVTRASTVPIRFRGRSPGRPC